MSNPTKPNPKSLSFDDAVISFILKQQGTRTCCIARRLGTSPISVNEVLLGNIHPTAADEAAMLLAA